jgi:hypothetical protein
VELRAGGVSPRLRQGTWSAGWVVVHGVSVGWGGGPGWRERESRRLGKGRGLALEGGHGHVDGPMTASGMRWRWFYCFLGGWLHWIWKRGPLGRVTTCMAVRGHGRRLMATTLFFKMSFVGTLSTE